MSEGSYVTWEKHDKLADDVTELKTQTAVHGNKLEQHDVQFHRMNAESSERHGQLVTAIEALASDFKDLDTDYHERQGANKSEEAAQKSQHRTIVIGFSLLALLVAVLELWTP